MKNLNEEILRSKQIMGLNEGLNLPKLNPTTFAKQLLQRSIITVENPDKSNPDYIGYYNQNHELVMQYCLGRIEGNCYDNQVNIDSYSIYRPMQNKFPELDNYDKMMVVLKPVIEEYLQKKVGTIHHCASLKN